MKHCIWCLFIAALAAGCHKTRVATDLDRPTTDLSDGFGDLNNLNGYMYMSQEYTSKSLLGFSKILTGYAIFRDPASTLTKTYDRLSQSILNFNTSGNPVYVGVVQCHTLGLGWNQNQSFNSGYYNSPSVSMPDYFPVNAQWNVEGSKTFKGFNTVLGRGFPSINDSLVLLDTVYTTKGYTLNIGRCIGNYDSALVQLRSLTSGANFVFRSGPGADKFILSMNQVLQLWTSSSAIVTCRIAVYNYATRKLYGKAHQFETGTRLVYKPVLKTS